MDAFGSIAHFPVRHYLAATALQAKGLDQLVNDPGGALRRLGELSVKDRAAADDAARAQQTALTADRALSARLMRQTLDALRGDDARTSARPDAGADLGADPGADRLRTQVPSGGGASIDISPEATPEATLAKARVVIAATVSAATVGDGDAPAGAKEDQGTDGPAAEDPAPDLARFLALDDRDSPYGVIGGAGRSR